MDPVIEDTTGSTLTFESIWADIAQRLESRLLAEGVSRSLVEDIVQEAGTRLFVRWAQIDTNQPLMPLALTIARRLVVDHHRKHNRVELRDTLVDRGTGVDIEQRALARIHLSAVHLAIRKLKPRYQTLLLAEAGYVGVGSGGTATRTARSRARQGLKVLMERASDAAWGMAGPVVGLSRRSSIRLKQAVGGHDWTLVGQAAAGAVLFLTSLALPRAIAPGPQAPSASPLMVTSVHEMGSVAAGSAPADKPTRTGFLSEPSRSASDGGSPRMSGSGLLPPLADSKGNNTGEGYVGLDGLNETGQGTGTVAGETVDWTYRAEYRQPQCVRWALEGKSTLRCDASPKAGAGISLKHRDREVGVDTSS